MHKAMIFAAAALLASACARAAADGCFVWRKGVDINEPSQKAILLHDAGREDLILQVKYAGPVAEFGWLVPVPGRPMVEKASMDCFYELSRYFQAINKRYRKGRQTDAAVTVLERKTVGVYDVAVLAAAEAQALSGWLTKNRFNWPADRKEVLDHYVKKKWFFVAVRISLARADDDTAERLRTGELHPLKISFDTAECVYPLKISSANRGATDVHLYVISARPLACPRMDFFSENPKPVMKPAQFSSYFRACPKALPRLEDKSWVVLKHTAMFHPDTMEDLTFRPLDPDRQTALKAQFGRFYCGGRDSPMHREVLHVEAEVGRITLHGGSGELTSPHRRLGLIKNRLKVLAEAAPKAFVPLALALIEQGRGSLLEWVSLAGVKAPVDEIAAAAAERVSTEPDERVQAKYWGILLSAGARATAGRRILVRRLGEPGEAAAVLAQPYWIGQLLKNCPDPAALERLAELMDVKDPKDDRRMRLARSAARALSASGDKRAVDLLIPRLRGHARDAAARALVELNDPRAAGPLAEAEVTSAVLEALAHFDRERAFRHAWDALSSKHPPVRRDAVRHLVRGGADKDDRAKVWAQLLRLAQTETDAAVLDAVAFGLYELANKHGMDARKAWVGLETIAKRVDSSAVRQRALNYVQRLKGL